VAQDWDAIRRLGTADFVLEDRGKRALVTGDVEAWIASMQFTSQPGWRPQSNLIGTFGDHIALERMGSMSWRFDVTAGLGRVVGPAPERPIALRSGGPRRWHG
jgi:hypothetical protein